MSKTTRNLRCSRFQNSTSTSMTRVWSACQSAESDLKTSQQKARLRLLSNGRWSKPLVLTVSPFLLFCSDRKWFLYYEAQNVKLERQVHCDLCRERQF